MDLLILKDRFVLTEGVQIIMVSKKLIALAVLLAGVSFSAFAKGDNKKEEVKPVVATEAHKEELKPTEHHDDKADAKSHKEEAKHEEHHESKPKKTCKRKSHLGDDITARLNRGEKLGLDTTHVVPPAVLAN